jgi:hypothetical protein
MAAVMEVTEAVTEVVMEVVTGAVTATRISAAVIMAAGTLAVDTLAAGRHISVHSPGRRSTATVHSRPVAMS